MSEPFERRLAGRVLDVLRENNIASGDRLLAEFTDSDTAGEFIEAIFEVVDREEFPIEFEDETQFIPGFILEGELPVYTVRVRSDDPEASDDWSDYDVTQGYATTLRNELATEDVDGALLLAYQTGVEIDTLDTTRSLFDDDGLLPMRTFREDILEHEGDLHKQGRALMNAIREYIDDVGETSTTEIRTLCEIRDCLESGDANELPDLISNLGGFVREDRFSDWSDEGGTEDQLQQKAEEILKDNKRHAERFEDATSVGVNTREKLLEDYEDDFVDEFLASGSNWQSIDHTRARNNTRSYHEPGGDGPGAGTPTPTFESIDIDAQQSKVHSVGSGSTTRRGVLAVPSAEGVRIALEFSANIENEPTTFVGPNGNDVGELTLSDRTITATISNGDDVLPRFASLKVYIGHKQARGILNVGLTWLSSRSGSLALSAKMRSTWMLRQKHWSHMTRAL